MTRSVLAAAALAAAFMRGSDRPGPDQAEAVARNWVGEGTVQTARRSDSGWEIDVVRPDGSLVEITLGSSLQLLELDEEAGSGGTRAHDEVRGVRRRRAIRAALRATGPAASSRWSATPERARWRSACGCRAGQPWR